MACNTYKTPAESDSTRAHLKMSKSNPKEQIGFRRRYFYPNRENSDTINTLFSMPSRHFHHTSTCMFVSIKQTVPPTHYCH